MIDKLSRAVNSQVHNLTSTFPEVIQYCLLTLETHSPYTTKESSEIVASVRRCVIEDENYKANNVLIMRCCCVHAGIQEIFDGSGLPSKPRARNTTRGNDCSAGQEELERSEHPPTEFTRVYWGQPPLAHIPNFCKVQGLVRKWPSSFKLGSSRTEMSAQGPKLFSFLSSLPGKFWGGT